MQTFFKPIFFILLLIVVYVTHHALKDPFVLKGSTDEGSIHAIVVDVYDGDTLFVNIEGVPNVFGTRIGIRLAGIDTPEMRGKCHTEKLHAIEARDYLRSLASEGTMVELKDVSRGKYFRLIADVYIDSVNVSEGLLGRNLAVKYSGKERKHDWCE
jgi:micrococcal nuclease